MPFLIIVSALFALLAGLTALATFQYAHGVLLVLCGLIIGIAGLDAFS
jgi:hypothetical protein